MNETCTELDACVEVDRCVALDWFFAAVFNDAGAAVGSIRGAREAGAITCDTDGVTGDLKIFGDAVCGP